MAIQAKLDVQVRDGAAQATRRAGSIPAVLYGHKVDAKSLSVNAVAFDKVFANAGYSSLIALNADGAEHIVLVRDIQRHPIKNDVTHIDFYQVNMEEEITAEIPLVFIGEAPAVKDMGGVFVRQLSEIEIEALPQNLPHDIKVDISVLDNFEKVVHVKDLPIPEGVKVLQDAEEVVALVQAPKTQEELDAELSAEVTEDVEAVEGVKDKPEEGEEGATPEAAAEEKKAE